MHKFEGRRLKPGIYIQPYDTTGYAELKGENYFFSFAEFRGAYFLQITTVRG